MKLTFTVRGQQIRQTDVNRLASDSWLYISGKVSFDAEWSDITSRYLTFELEGSSVIHAYLDSAGEFKESLGVSLCAGLWLVSAHGSNTNGKIIDTVPTELYVAKSGGSCCCSDSHIAPNVAAQIGAFAVEALQTAEKAAAKLDMNIDELHKLENSVSEAESARVTSENARIQAENRRVDAEQKRVEAENERKSSEDIRQSNESSRIDAEADRAEAELSRSSAESERNTAEQQRKANEEARQSSEAKRVDAENKRVNVESLRELAEGNRKKAEAARAEAESARVTAEDKRVSAENTRVLNENSRKTAETARATAESTRQSNENTRKVNENARQDSENSRVTAEAQRASEFAGFAGRIEAVEAELGTKADKVYALSSGDPWSADDCVNEPVRYVKLYGASEQTTYEGRNLLDVSDISQFSKIGYCRITGGDVTSNINNNYFCYLTIPIGKFPITIEGGTEFTFYVPENPPDKYVIILIYGERKNGGLYQQETQAGTTVTIRAADDFVNIDHIELRFNRSPERFTDTATVFTKFMIAKGSVATPYDPYVGGIPSPNPDYPQEIRCNDMTYDMLGRNLWNDDADFGIVNNYPSGNGYYGYPLYLKPNTTYGVSVQANLSYGSIDRSYIVMTVEAHYSITGNLNTLWIAHRDRPNVNIFPGDFKYITTTDNGILFVNVSGGSYKNDLNRSIKGLFIFEAPNNEAYPYTPYFNGGSVTAPELCAVGDVRDEWDAVTGKGVRRIKKLVLNGSGDWSVYNSNGFMGFKCTALDDIYYRANGLCNQLRVSTSASKVPNSLWIGVNSRYIYAVYNSYYDDSLSDYGLANWKAHLDEQPLEIYYVTNTPEEFTTAPAPLTTPDGYAQLLPSGEGFAGEVEVEYAVDIEKRYVPRAKYDELEARVAALEMNVIGG